MSENDRMGLDALEAEQSPICEWCGVSMLPPEHPGDTSRCENADCEGDD